MAKRKTALSRSPQSPCLTLSLNLTVSLSHSFSRHPQPVQTQSRPEDNWEEGGGGRGNLHTQPHTENSTTADDEARSLDGLGGVLNKSDDLQKRLRALLQATDEFFKPEDDASLVRGQPSLEQRQLLAQQSPYMQQSWQPVSEDMFEEAGAGELDNWQSQQLISAHVHPSPLRRPYHMRPTLEAVREGTCVFVCEMCIYVCVLVCVMWGCGSGGARRKV